MIIELYGLPATGKSTLARAFEGEGAVCVATPRGSKLLALSVRYCCLHLRSAVLQLWYLARFAQPKTRAALFKSLFVAHAAKWERACSISRRGGIAILDQGHHQNLLSLFANEPSDSVLRAYLRVLPRPDMVLVLSTSPGERRERLSHREVVTTETAERRAVGEAVFPRTLELLKGASRPVTDYSGEGKLVEVLSKNISYVTIARMPTEKAHGISIAQLCGGLSSLGAKVSLVVPKRRNALIDSVADYYGVSNNFSVESVPSPDFLGKGLRHPLFFVFQRLLFVRAVARRGVAPGTIYTREPEIAAFFARSHRTVYEAHRWPTGLSGWLTARLLRSVSLVVCNSRGTEAAVRRAGITRSLVAPNGFDSAMFDRVEGKDDARARLGISSALPVALYAGLLSKGKGIHTLFAAAQHLNGVAQVVVIGGAPEEIEVLRKKYPSVQFLGYRPYTELANNLAAADVLVLPNTLSDIESSAYTSPIKLFGYMASGVPIVASEVPAVTDVLRSNEAWFVTPDSPEALAEGVERALTEGPKSIEMAARAKEWAKDYTWGTRAARIYSELSTTL